MARVRKARAIRGKRSRSKISMTFRLAPSKLAAAQRILETSTATETIETALDMVVFRRELIDGTRAMLGVRLASADGRRRK